MIKRNCFAALAALCVSVALFSCLNIDSYESDATTSLSLTFGNLSAARAAVGRAAADGVQDEFPKIVVKVEGGSVSQEQSVPYDLQSQNDGAVFDFVDLPINVPLVVSGEWFTGDGLLAYRGSTNVTLAAGPNSVGLRLNPVELPEPGPNPDQPDPSLPGAFEQNPNSSTVDVGTGVTFSHSDPAAAISLEIKKAGTITASDVAVTDGSYSVDTADNVGKVTTTGANTNSVTITFNTAGNYTVNAVANKTGFSQTTQSYTLTVEQTLSSLTGTPITTEIALSLNDETLSGGITIDNGGVLTLKTKNGTATVGREDNPNISMFTVNTGGKLVIENGVIIDGRSQTSHGTSMIVLKGGTLELSGKVTNGVDSQNAGGITVNANSTLTLSSGAEISNCWQDNSDGRGGAISVYGSGSRITMQAGAKITGNTANDGAAIYGSNSNTFLLSGGEIIDNTVSGFGWTEATIKWGGTFTMSSGTISGSGGASVIYIEKGDGGGGTFSYTNGTISGNDPVVQTEGGAQYNSGDFNGTEKTIRYSDTN